MRLPVLCMIIILSPMETVAEISWMVSSRPFLEARSTEVESDASLRALCRNAAIIELRVGAYEDVGGEEGEAVTVSLESDGRTVSISGTSRKSEDFEMTAGVELVTQVSADHPVFEVLRTGKLVILNGSSMTEPSIWEGEQMSVAVDQFLKACTEQQFGLPLAFD